MPSRSPKTDLHGPRATAIIGIALIAATALVAFLTIALAAKASTASGSLACGRDDRGPIWPVHVRTGATKVLVPRGAVSLLVCNYNGMNALGRVPQFGLRGAGGTADHATISRLTDELDALKPSHGAINCPMDDESQDVAAFSYPSGPSVVVTVGINGCNQITNGHIRRLGLGKPLVAQMSGLAEPVTGLKWATVVGHLRLCGGPYPGHCYVENDGNGDRVVVHAPGAPWLAMAQIEHGRFRFTVAGSGTYTFGFYAGNTLVKQLRARVTAGRTTKVVFALSIP